MRGKQVDIRAALQSHAIVAMRLKCITATEKVRAVKESADEKIKIVLTTRHECICELATLTS